MGVAVEGAWRQTGGKWKTEGITNNFSRRLIRDSEGESMDSCEGSLGVVLGVKRIKNL